jgi:hypothetical protein
MEHNPTWIQAITSCVMSRLFCLPSILQTYAGALILTISILETTFGNSGIEQRAICVTDAFIPSPFEKQDWLRKE